MSIDKANQYINYLTSILNCDPVEFDENKNVQFILDDSMPLVIGYIEELNSLIINIFIVSLSKEGAEQENAPQEDPMLLYDILCGAYMWGYTASGNLAIDRETNFLTLQKILDLSSSHTQVQAEDFQIFEDMCIALVSAARYWRQYVTNIQKGSTSYEHEFMPHSLGMLKV